MVRAMDRVRPMEARDLPRILEIEQDAFSTPWSAASFRSLLNRREVILRVLEQVPEPESRQSESPEGSEERPEVIGYGVIWRAGDEGELANIAIARRMRGRGLGARFLDRLIAEARGRGIRSLFLEVRISNQVARRLYASRGFREIGRRPAYYSSPKEDGLVLMKEL